MKTSVIKYLEPLHVFNGSCDVISSKNSGFSIKTVPIVAIKKTTSIDLSCIFHLMWF